MVKQTNDHRLKTNVRAIEPDPGRPPLFPYQRRGVARLVNSTALGRVVMLAWDMGTGKSRVAIEAADQRRAQRVIVVCPAIGRVVWPDQISQWGRRNWHVRVVTRMEDIPAKGTLAPSIATWLIVPSSLLSLYPKGEDWQARVEAFAPDIIIVDEAQQFAHSTAARTRCLYGAKCDRVGAFTSRTVPQLWLMSGSFVTNYTSDLWTHLHATAPETIRYPGKPRPLAEDEFRDRYSVLSSTPYGMNVSGSKNTSDLRSRIAGIADRLTMAQAHPDMPPLFFTADPIPLPDWASREELAGHLERAIPENLTPEQLLAYVNDPTHPLATVRRTLGIYKAKGIIEWVTDRLAANLFGKLIVFAHHITVLDQLEDALVGSHGVVRVDGSTPDHQRLRAIRAFQDPTGPRLFVGQTHASGTSLTLTAAQDVVFAEGDWSPMVLAQAAARAHRVGQTKPVTAHMLYLPGTLDEHIARAATRKASEIAKLFDTVGDDDDIVPDANTAIFTQQEGNP
jgi:hypothetical protein